MVFIFRLLKVPFLPGCRHSTNSLSLSLSLSLSRALSQERIFACASVSHGTKYVRKVAEREFCNLFRIFTPNFAPNLPEMFEGFSCFVSQETETIKNWIIHQQPPPFFNAKVPGKFEEKIHKIGESSRGNTIGATGRRASEREICLWEDLWEGGFQRISEVFRQGFQRFSEIFQLFSEVFSETLSEADLPQRLSVLLPLIVLPLELSPKKFVESRQSKVIENKTILQ